VAALLLAHKVSAIVAKSGADSWFAHYASSLQIGRKKPTSRRVLVAMSDVEESGRESGHRNIDANAPTDIAATSFAGSI
jgi:hypothetical protein